MKLPYSLIKTAQLQAKDQEIAQLKLELENAAEFIKNIEKGNLDIQIDQTDNKRQGLITALLGMLGEMKKMAEQEKERAWVSEGLAMFVDILRKNHDDITTFSLNIITSLVRYLNACQGGLFVVNNEDEADLHLQLLGSYAYERKKYLQKRVNAGEGILGQAYLEKDTIYLTEVPNDYVNITSGLGGANPRSILIVPLKVNEQVFGMIEIASFNKFGKYQIEFLEKLGESIASTISNVKINEKTKILLEDARYQADQLKVQDEIMRQSMEELTATQESQRRLEDELRKSAEALQLKLTQLEEAKEEIIQVKKMEEERTQERLEAQKKATEKIVFKFKETEQNLKKEIEKLTQELNNLKNNK